MPINPNIALGVQPLQIQQVDPNAGMNALMRAMQIKSAMGEQDMNELRTQEYKRGIDQKNKMLEVLGGQYGRPEDREEALLRGGFVKEATDLQKNRVDAAKVQADTDKNRVEAAHKRVDSFGQVMGFVHNAPTVENAQAAVQHLVTLGVIPAEQAQAAMAPLAQNPTPEGIRQWAALGYRAALSAKDQLTQYQTRNTGGTTDTLGIDPVTGQTRTVNTVQNTQSPDNAATNATSRANNAATVGATIRGQNLLDARARETNALGKTQIVETPNGFVIVDKNTGASRPATGADGQPLKGKANDRVMTDSQAKANLFGTRMREADKILNSLSYSPTAVNAKVAVGELPVVGGAFGAMANLASPDAVQQAEQAQRDFINAVLRRESGAAISASEFENARKQYFPQPNDKPGNLAQKARNRQLAIAGMEAEVPGGFRVPPSLAGPGSATPASDPTVDALVKKYGGS